MNNRTESSKNAELEGISRRSFLYGMAGAIGASRAPSMLRTSGTSSDGRPNIILFIGEGIRSDEMSWTGNPLIKTPNIDRLAREGLTFRNAFVVNSLCSPSRATMLTGFYSHVTGVIDNLDRSIPSRFPIVSDMLRDAGYEIAFIGKSHIHGGLRDHYWDYFFGFNESTQYYSPTVFEGADGKYTGPTTYEGYVDDILTDRALAWLARKHDRPFCLFFSFYAPHAPFFRSRDLLDMYNGTAIPVPATFNDDLKGYPRKPHFAKARNKIGTQVVSDAARSLEELVKDHYAGVVSNDNHLGQMLEQMARSGQLENTAILLTSDHGYFLGEWRLYDKRFMHEPSIRVPMLIWYPKAIRAGLHTNRMALNLDIAPTILNLAGIEVPLEMQGRSLAPFFRGSEPMQWRKDWYYEYLEYPNGDEIPAHRGVRTDQYKLIHYYMEPETFELYDLREDPGELNNLCSDVRYASVMNQLQQRIEELRRETGDVSQ